MADKTTSRIAISAPADGVMAVIADFESYPQWATGVRSTEVLATGPDGRASQVRFELDAGMIRDTYVLGYDWDGTIRVSWELAEAGSVVSEMTGAYQLSGDADGTDVRYELAVGIKIPMIGMLKRRAEKMIIDTALKGLKARAEAMG